MAAWLDWVNEWLHPLDASPLGVRAPGGPVPMRTSIAGRVAIENREGCRLIAYRDQRSIPTIGFGHTSGVAMGTECTRAEADTWLSEDLLLEERAVNGSVKIKLTQNQFDACVSLCHNIGVYGFQGSTVVRKLNRGLRQEAADAFLMWAEPPSLKLRRQSEREQFLRP